VLIGAEPKEVSLLLLVDGVCIFVCVDLCWLLMVYVYLFVLVG
jgi:hypothetical protein